MLASEHLVPAFRGRGQLWSCVAIGLLAAALVLLGGSGEARAAILPATTLDGPSEEIVGFGGVAMAEDGTGGVVYLKRVGGVAHVFVSRYVAGHWQTPIRVDGEQPFAASWPRIGAADDGELVVIWATPFATEDEKPVEELLSATLGPGGSSFGQAQIVDPDIQEGTGTSPDLAMSPTGQADVVYRIVQPHPSIPLQKPGDVQETVRLAHFGGERWTRLGAVNREGGVSMRPPTAANAPQVAINAGGNGIVVWQEPELPSKVARIWARRVFGTSLSYVMPVSATSYGGKAISEDSDAPSVAFTFLGQAAVAYRQQAGRSSPLPGPRIFLNLLSNGEAASGAEFEGATIADNSVPGGKNASIGRPSVDLEERESLRLLYDDNGASRVVNGNDAGLTGALSLGSPFAGSSVVPAGEQQSASVIGRGGAGVSAWPSQDAHGAPAVAVREDYTGGGVQTGLVAGGAGGVVSELSVGRSGLGDGLVAFQQGPLGNAAIVATEVTAAPLQFVVNAPKGWIKPSAAKIAWEPAGSADGPLSYDVVLDGHLLRVPAGTLSYKIAPSLLGSGKHRLALLATDRYGTQTLTPSSNLEIDGQPPSVSVRRTGRGGQEVSVAVTDGLSQVETKAVQISFGDGSHSKGRSRVRHRFAHAGVYEVVVRARDRLGNSGSVRRLVSVG
jgi:hypothetical protein